MSRISARQESSGIVHHRHSNGNVTHAGAIVDKCFVLPLSIPTVNICHADFQFQRRGHAVAGLRPVVLVILAVLVQIDEAGCNHKTLGIDRLPPLQCRAADSSNFATADSHIAHRIQSRFRIHHSSVCDRHVIRYFLRAKRPCPAKCTDKRHDAETCQQHFVCASVAPLRHRCTPSFGIKPPSFFAFEGGVKRFPRGGML